MVITRLKTESSHLRFKTVNKCLNTPDPVEMVERNKDEPFPSSGVLYIVTGIMFKVTVLESSSFLAKKQAKQSSVLVIEVMMIPHMNIQNASTFTTDNSKTKQDMKSHFSGLTLNNNLTDLV